MSNFSLEWTWIFLNKKCYLLKISNDMVAIINLDN